MIWVFFEALGDPVPEPRPRSNRATGRTYVPPDADAWKDSIRAAAKLALMLDPVGAVPLAGVPFGATLEFRFARPKGHFRSGRFADLLKPSAPTNHVKTPDIDNLVKAALDSLGTWRGLGSLLWADDSQVVRCVVSKRYVDPGQSSGLSATLYTLDGPSR